MAINSAGVALGLLVARTPLQDGLRVYEASVTARWIALVAGVQD